MCRTHEACWMRLFLWTSITSRHDVTSGYVPVTWHLLCQRSASRQSCIWDPACVGHMPQQNKCEPATVCFQSSLHLIGYEGQLVHWECACMFIYHCLHMSRQINLSTMPSPWKSFHLFDWMLVISELAKEHLWIAGAFRLILWQYENDCYKTAVFVCICHLKWLIVLYWIMESHLLCFQTPRFPLVSYN